jgi:D-tyrosyl-tRNA(Tyr) deacylase
MNTLVQRIPMSQPSTTTTSTSTITSSQTSTTELYMNKKRSKKKKTSGGGGKGFAGSLKALQMNAFNYAGTVRPGKQSPQKIVVAENVLMFPDYAEDSIVSWKDMKNKKIYMYIL